MILCDSIAPEWNFKVPAFILERLYEAPPHSDDTTAAAKWNSNNGDAHMMFYGRQRGGKGRWEGGWRGYQTVSYQSFTLCVGG